jgi:hypothetical protein
VAGLIVILAEKIKRLEERSANLVVASRAKREQSILLVDQHQVLAARQVVENPGERNQLKERSNHANHKSKT